MSLVTFGLGVGALVTGGLGGALGPAPPPPPAPVPIVQSVGGGGTGGSEFDAYSTDRAFGADDGLDREPSDYFEPAAPDEELSWADQLARAFRFWSRTQPGAPRGPTVHVGGAKDAGKAQEHWAVADLRTAGATDAGKIQETWESPDEFATAGAKDAGKVEEDW
jgi:hypothetical protein